MAAPLLWLAALALAATPAYTQAIQDSRCYLMNGGAVESFFISEDTPVGSIIGTLSVNGDPNEVTGDISLRIQEKNPAVALAAGSKNLTLTRPLDREEQLGPSSVYVNVRCDRRHTSDPSFVIPVSVRVWDVNDNAPAWRGGPYRARVSELAGAGARVLAAPAADPDQAGPHATVRYAVLPGPASDYVAFASELDSTIIIRRPLDYETLHTFTVRLRASDAGTPPKYNDTTLTVEVLDADDQNPKFGYDHYVVVVGDGVKEGSILTPSPAPIHAADQDVGISAPVRYSVSGEGAARVHVNPDTAVLSATAGLLERDVFDYTVVIKATQVDNPDRYALATLALRRHARDTTPAGSVGSAGLAGSRSAGSVTGVRFTRRVFVARVAEDAAPGTVLLTLTTNAPADKPLQYYVSERGFLQQFAINSAGDVLLRRALPRNESQVLDYNYQVMATDGVTNDTASIEISIQHVNEWEPRFKHAHYEFLLHANTSARNTPAGNLHVSTLHVHDGDKEDNVTLHLSGPDARLLSVNSAGEVFVSEAALNATELHVVATAVDSGIPPRQTSVPVLVRVSSAVGGARGSVPGGAPVLLAAFSCALALLAMLVAALLLHLCRLKRKRQIKDKNTISPLPEKTIAGVNGGSLQSVSAGASSILAASTCSLERTQANANANASSANTSSTSASTNVADKGALSDHLAGVAGGAGRSGVAWPSTTIPARLKRLSWDDAQISEERREVAEATNTTVAEHMNLTVYF